MNEKIKELSRQATEYANNQEQRGWSDAYRDAFAELIIKECAIAFEAEVDTWKEMDPYQGSIKRQGTKGD